MTDSSSRTLVCSIVFLDIVEYSKRAVADQLQLKQLFNDILAKALTPIVARDRVVLDTGDGAAITFLGDPEDALLVGMEIRDAVAEESRLDVRMGINLGPVRLVRDLNAQLNIIGDGINVAQRVMSFAGTGELLVSRSFFEVVSCLSSDYTSLFGYVGARTDKHVREHEVYLVGKGKPAPRRPEPGAAKPRRGLRARLAAALAAPGPFGLQRRTLVAAPLIFICIVGAAARVQQQREEQRARAQTVAALPVVKPPVARPKAPATGTEPVAAARPANAATQIQLQIAPWGEVFVDGRSRGVSPPMRVIEITPGPHKIEIRNANFPPHVTQVEVRPGQEVRIRHRFGDTQGGKR
jgi:class 3 adenylate cyclase